jgi:prefoldin subunit 5
MDNHFADISIFESLQGQAGVKPMDVFRTDAVIANSPAELKTLAQQYDDLATLLETTQKQLTDIAKGTPDYQTCLEKIKKIKEQGKSIAQKQKTMISDDREDIDRAYMAKRQMLEKTFDDSLRNLEADADNQYAELEKSGKVKNKRAFA